MKKRTVFIIGGIVIVGAVGAVALTGSKEDNKKPAVATMKVLSQHALTESGVVAAAHTQEVALQGMKLAQIMVTDGQAVHQGDVLMTLGSETATTDIAAAQSDVTKIQNDIDYQQQVVNNAVKTANANKDDTGAKDALTQANMALADSQSDLASAQAKLTATQAEASKTVTAEFDGTVALDDTNPDTPKLRVLSAEKRVVATVGDSDYSKLQVGKPATVNAVADHSKVLVDKITNISAIPTASSSTKLVTYNFTVGANNTFRYGQPVTVSIDQSGFILPKTAVRLVDGQLHVLAVKSGKASATTVTGEKQNNGYLITGNLAAGTRIVTNYGQAKDGEKINGND